VASPLVGMAPQEAEHAHRSLLARAVMQADP